MPCEQTIWSVDDHGLLRSYDQAKRSIFLRFPDSDERDFDSGWDGIDVDEQSIPADMLSEELAFLRRYPEWQALLQAYWDAHQQAKEEVAEFDGWLARLTEVADVPAEALSGIHGKLIAFGYLKFELTPKDTSLRYQLTPLGRSAVTGEASSEQSDSSGEAELAMSA